MGDDKVTAELERIRADLNDGSVYPRRVVEIHAPRLLAAVDAVLKLADEWEDSAAIECPSDYLREAITSALTGKEPDK